MAHIAVAVLDVSHRFLPNSPGSAIRTSLTCQHRARAPGRTSPVQGTWRPVLAALHAGRLSSVEIGVKADLTRGESWCENCRR